MFYDLLCNTDGLFNLPRVLYLGQVSMFRMLENYSDFLIDNPPCVILAADKMTYEVFCNLLVVNTL
jgi:hypothetical protein